MNPVKDIAVSQQLVGQSLESREVKKVPVSEETVAVRQTGNESVIEDDAAREAQEVQRSKEAQQAVLADALEQINEQAGGFSPALKFEADEDSGVVIIKVLNRSTGEVIRQLPPEAVVKASEEGNVPALVTETV